jgi:hypothetical protein
VPGLLCHGCATTWHREDGRFEREPGVETAETVAVGEGRRVVGDELGGLRVDRAPFCRPRTTREVQLVRVERSVGLEVGTLPWMGVIGVGIYAISAGVPLSMSDDSTAADGERALLGGALVLTPFLLGLALAPPGDEVTRRLPEGASSEVVWSGPAAACSEGSWAAADGVPLALQARRAGPTASTLVVERHVTTAAGGTPPTTTIASFTGLFGWCRDLQLVASSGDVDPVVDPGDPVAAAWSTGDRTLDVSVPGTPLPLGDLAALDAEFAVLARGCCEQQTWPATDALCRHRCSKAVDAAGRLACENTCRAERTVEVCR